MLQTLLQNAAEDTVLVLPTLPTQISPKNLFRIPLQSVPPLVLSSGTKLRKPCGSPLYCLMALTAAANKAVAERSFSVLRQSLCLLNRNFSAAASHPQATIDGDAEKTERKKKKNLFDVLQFLPNWGIGYKVAKSHWRDVSYALTKINLYKDGRHGKAWGIRYKAGVQAGDQPIKISGVNKRGWKYIKESNKKVQDLQKEREQITV